MTRIVTTTYATAMPRTANDPQRDPKQRQPRRKLASELDRRWADAMARDD
jgi:hypothetical protein